MGISLKDQLLKAGLVNKKQVKRSKHEKYVSRKKNTGKVISPEINKTLLEKQAKEKLNQEKNKQLNIEKQKLENLAQVKQLIETNRLKQDDYDEPYYFKIEKKIKKIFVSEEIAQKLSLGQLDIVKFNNRFEIVPAKVAEQIEKRGQGSLLVLK